jgi:hypothetical protein
MEIKSDSATSLKSDTSEEVEQCSMKIHPKSKDIVALEGLTLGQQPFGQTETTLQLSQTDLSKATIPSSKTTTSEITHSVQRVPLLIGVSYFVNLIKN